MRVNKVGGQSMVELAVVLAAFCLSVLAMVQLFVFCRNKLELQRMAQISSDHVVPSTPLGHTLYPQFNRLWGRVLAPNVYRHTTQRLTSWRGFGGISTVRAKGSVISNELSCALLPGAGFTSTLGSAQQNATSISLVEPFIPGDHS